MEGQTHIKEGKKFYDSLGKIYCPYFKKEVELTGGGFNHLIYKSERNRRSDVEIRARLKSLKVVEEILKNSGTVQEIEKKVSGQFDFGFIAIIDNKKYKVVAGTDLLGNRIIFRSVIPSWKTNKRDKELHKIGTTETKKPSQ